MKRLFAIVIAILCVSVLNAKPRINSSTACIDVGYSNKNQIILISQNSVNRVSFGFMASFQLNEARICGCDDHGYTGVDYTGIIHSQDYPDDYRESHYGTPFTFNALLGVRVVGKLFINGIVGLQRYESWNNYYDKYHILSSSGWYNIKTSYGSKFNYGVSVNYTYKYLNVGVGYTKYNGIFASIGFNFAGGFCK